MEEADMDSAEIIVDTPAYYAASVKDFLVDAADPDMLAEVLLHAHESYDPEHPTSEEQKRAWISEVRFLQYSFRDIPELEDMFVALEMPLNKTGERIDIVLCGRNGTPPFVHILEAKTWHTTRRKGRRYKIYPYHGNRLGKRLFINLYDFQGEIVTKIRSAIFKDPREQVELYRSRVVEALNRHTQRNTANRVFASVVLYNCKKITEEFRFALDYCGDGQPFETIPIYTQRAENGSRAIADLIDMLKVGIVNDGKSVYETLMEALNTT